MGISLNIAYPSKCSNSEENSSYWTNRGHHQIHVLSSILLAPKKSCCNMSDWSSDVNDHLCTQTMALSPVHYRKDSVEQCLVCRPHAEIRQCSQELQVNIPKCSWKSAIPHLFAGHYNLGWNAYSNVGSEMPNISAKDLDNVLTKWMLPEPCFSWARYLECQWHETYVILWLINLSCEVSKCQRISSSFH